MLILRVAVQGGSRDFYTDNFRLVAFLLFVAFQYLWTEQLIWWDWTFHSSNEWPKHFLFLAYHNCSNIIITKWIYLDGSSTIAAWAEEFLSRTFSIHCSTVRLAKLWMHTENLTNKKRVKEHSKNKWCIDSARQPHNAHEISSWRTNRWIFSFLGVMSTKIFHIKNLWHSCISTCHSRPHLFLPSSVCCPKWEQLFVL